MSRQEEFQKIIVTVKNESIVEMCNNLIIHGDSLEVIKKFPDHSVSLILTDPPYHSTNRGLK